MVDVVGLRFVTEGEKAALTALSQYQQGLRSLSSLQDKHVAAMNRALAQQDREARRAYQNMLRYQREKEQAAQREAAAQERAAAQAIAAQNRRDAEERRLYQNYLRYQREKEQAAQREAAAQERAARAAARIAEQDMRAAARIQRQNAVETQRLEQAYGAMLDTLNPLGAAQQRYNQQVATIQRYHRQASSSAEALKADLDALAAAYARAGSPIDRFGNVTAVAGTRANTLGLVLQQTGYQVGDFAIQIQSGTNAFVAFGQQATQLAGLLYLIPGAVGVIAGTVASIAIPVITGFLAYFDRIGEQAEKVADTFREQLTRDLQGATSAVTAFSAALSTSVQRDVEDAIEQYGRLDESLKQFMDRMLAFRREQAFVGIETAFATLTETPALTAAVQDFQDIQKSITEIFAEIDTLRTQEDPLGNVAREIGNLQKELVFLQTEGFEALGVPIGTFQEIMRLQGAVQDALDARNADALVNTISSLSAIVNGLAEGPLRTAMLGALLDIENQARLFRQGIDESSGAVARTHKNLLSVLNTMLDIAGVDLSGAFNTATRSVDMMNARLTATLGIVGQLLGAIGSIGFDTVAMRAETAALRAGKSAGEARIDAEMAQTEARLRQAGPLGLIERLGLAAQRRALEERLAAQTELDVARQAALPSGAGGGGGANAFVSMFPELQAAYEAAQQLAQAYRQEVEILDSALANNLITQSQYNDMLVQAQERYNQTIESANGYRETLDSLAQTLSSSMEDAFMSIAEGTASVEDAFRNMARTILAEVIRLAIVRPLVGQIMGFLGFPTAAVASANGNVFSGGNVIPFARGGVLGGGNVVPFANGGVVGSPTVFPMTNGRTGLMGEAGPEAIMPLKRGSDGKLGVAAQTKATPVDVRVYVDQNGNWQAAVERIADRRVQRQGPGIVRQSVQAVYAANSERKLR